MGKQWKQWQTILGGSKITVDGDCMHSLEITADIMNVANLLNKDWGRTYGSTYDTQYKSPIGYAGNGNYQFLHDADYVMFYPDSYYSRWRGQLGVKYTF